MQKIAGSVSLPLSASGQIPPLTSLPPELEIRPVFVELALLESVGKAGIESRWSLS